MKTPTIERKEYEIMSHIIGRALTLAEKHGVDYDHITCAMDLENAHTDCPLDLEKLLAADDFNFAHDIFGIRRHMDRTTGRLTGCFVPRYAKH